MAVTTKKQRKHFKRAAKLGRHAGLEDDIWSHVSDENMGDVIRLCLDRMSTDGLEGVLKILKECREGGAS